jgi:hypothetical protein
MKTLLYFRDILITLAVFAVVGAIFYGVSKLTSDKEDASVHKPKKQNPRDKDKLDVEYYKDSAYVISRHVDSVIDLETFIKDTDLSKIIIHQK